MIFLSIPQRIFVYQLPVLSIPLKNGSPGTPYNCHNQGFKSIAMWHVVKFTFEQLILSDDHDASDIAEHCTAH